MLRLEKFARAPENTALKGPELENLCNNRVTKSEYDKEPVKTGTRRIYSR